MGSIEGKIEFAAILLSIGDLSDEIIKMEKIRVLQREVEANKKRAIAAKIQREKFEMEDMADSKYHTLFNRRNGDPISLQQWAKRRPIEELENYLEELRHKPQHYRSLFRGDITGACDFLQKLIDGKK